MNERMPSRIQSSRKFLLLLSYFSIVKKNNNKGKKKMINYSFYAHLQTPVSQGKGRSRVQPWSNDGQNSNSGVTLGTPQRWKGPTYSTGQPCPPISAAPPLAAPDSEEGWDPSGQRSDCWFPERHDHHGHHRHLPWDSQARGQVPRVNSHPAPQQPALGQERGSDRLEHPSPPRPGSRNRRGLGEASSARGLGSSCADFRKPGRRSACDS